MYKYMSKLKINQADEFEKMAEFLENEVNIFSPKASKTNFFLKVAIYEAVNNAYFHGKFPITLSFSSLKDRLLIRIQDSGEGFYIDERLNLIKLKGTQQLLEEIVHEENGRGIYMMFETVDKVIFNKNGNEVLLVHSFIQSINQ